MLRSEVRHRPAVVWSSPNRANELRHRRMARRHRGELRSRFAEHPQCPRSRRRIASAGHACIAEERREKLSGETDSVVTTLNRVRKELNPPNASSSEKAAGVRRSPSLEAAPSKRNGKHCLSHPQTIAQPNLADYPALTETNCLPS